MSGGGVRFGHPADRSPTRGCLPDTYVGHDLSCVRTTKTSKRIYGPGLVVSGVVLENLCKMSGERLTFLWTKERSIPSRTFNPVGVRGTGD